jgi:hypothetical protein
MKLPLVISAALSVLLLSCGGPSNSPAGEESVPSAVLQALEGNYSMKLTDPTGTHYSTAVVKELASGQFQIARITVYGPVYYGFTLDGTSVNSAELGSGDISYKESIKKTTIRFQKQEFICELSK